MLSLPVEYEYFQVIMSFSIYHSCIYALIFSFYSVSWYQVCRMCMDEATSNETIHQNNTWRHEAYLIRLAENSRSWAISIEQNQSIVVWNNTEIKELPFR